MSEEVKIIKAHDINDGEKRTKDVINDNDITFNSLMLSPLILDGLAYCDYHRPSPIQQKAIPIGKCGFDLIIKSKSGTGKTIVFTTIALEMLNMTKSSLQTLILAPTREIAVQVTEVIRSIGCKFNDLTVETFIGGMPIEDDMKRANCQIAVGAPGRIRHLIEKKVLKTNQIRLLIFDEADKLMEESFEDDIEAIYHSLPVQKQVIASSATYPDNLEDFLQTFMTTPTHVSPNTETPLLLGLRQFVSIVKCNKNVLQMMQVKTTELNHILTNVPFTQCLIFSNSQIRVESISNNLNKLGWNSTFISAAMNQNKRLEVIRQLKDFKCRILLTTDLTARGIDINNVDLVINYDVPVDVSTYLHRMGRAGRFGSRGITVTIASESEELPKLKHMLAEIGGTDISINILPSDDLNSEMFRNNETIYQQINGEFITDFERNSEIVNSVLEMKNISNNNNRKKKKKNKKLVKGEHCEKSLINESTHNSSIDEDTEPKDKERCDYFAELNNLEKFLRESKSNGDGLQEIASREPVSLIEALANNSLNTESITSNSEQKADSCNSLNLLSKYKDLIPENLKQTLLENVNEKPIRRVLLDDAKSDSQLSHQDNTPGHSSKSKELKNVGRDECVTDNKIVLGDESKKRKRKENLIDSNKLLYERNVSLMHITKILIGSYNNTEIPQEVVAHVKILLKQLQLIEEEFRKNHLDISIDNIDNYINDKGQEKEINPNGTIEDIFKISYDYSINASTLHWSIFMDKRENQAAKKHKKNNNKFKKRRDSDNDNGKSNECYEDTECIDECVDEIDYNHDDNRQDEDETFGNDDECYNVEEYPNEYNEYTPEANNQDYNANMNEHFQNVYKQHKTKLMEFMENCKDVNKFNEFFKYWQEQLKASTDYVQQNLYLDVMNNYRYYKQ